MASQYHRRDGGEGMVLAFRQRQSPYRTVEVSLRALEAEAAYELTFDSTGAQATAKGSVLMGRYLVTILEPRGSELIVYRRAARARSGGPPGRRP